MNAEELRAVQSPLKARYKETADAARFTLRAVGTIHPGDQSCVIATRHGPTITAGLHPAAGGDGSLDCSGDMLLQALVACAGVTLGTVATALGLPVRSATVTAEGDMDFRGTLGVSKEVPIGFTEIRLRFEVDSDATEEQLANLLRLTDRYCVNSRTLQSPPKLSSTIVRRGPEAGTHGTGGNESRIP